MNSADMTPEILTPAEDDPSSLTPTDPDSGGDARGTRRRRWWFLGIGITLVTAAVLGAAFVPTPYVLVKPGAVRPAEPKVTVEGAPSYGNEGAILFTTVFVDDATLFGLARGALDDAIEIRSTDEVYGDRGRDETRRINQKEMDLSKLTAELEALSYLGYDVEFAAEGVRVIGVSEESPSSGTLLPGDVITSVDGRTVTVPAELREALEPLAPGDTVSLGVQRRVMSGGESASSSETDPESLTVEAELMDATAPEGHGDDGGDAGEPDAGSQGGRAVLGVVVEPFEPRIDSDVKVEIDSGEVTGPSAGLAWSLAIIDVLTPGSLTGDSDVAVTGEILADGRIGVIGGIAQKTSTVIRNGVDVFMYPADTPAQEQAEMRRIAGDDVDLVPVATLDEAVDHLAPDGFDNG